MGSGLVPDNHTADNMIIPDPIR